MSLSHRSRTCFRISFSEHRVPPFHTIANCALSFASQDSSCHPFSLAVLCHVFCSSLSLFTVPALLIRKTEHQIERRKPHIPLRTSTACFLAQTMSVSVFDTSVSVALALFFVRHSRMSFVKHSLTCTSFGALSTHVCEPDISIFTISVFALSGLCYLVSAHTCSYTHCHFFYTLLSLTHTHTHQPSGTTPFGLMFLKALSVSQFSGFVFAAV